MKNNSNLFIYFIILLLYFIIILLTNYIIKFTIKIKIKNQINNNMNIQNKSLFVYTNKYENYTVKEYKRKDLIVRQIKNDLIRIKNEINIYINIKTKDIKKIYFYKRNNPKITLIITLYNQKNFIPLIYSSILNQSLKDIEILFIDDGSLDNPHNTLKKYMKRDKRILLKKNKINKGAFYSRVKGVKFSKGEYILVLDPDDFLVNDILMKLYQTATKYNLDILQFYMVIGSPKKFQIWKIMKYKSGILYQPQIKDIFYYCKTRNIADKLIKRKIFLKSIDFMNKDFRKERFFVYDDDVTFYGLIKIAKSYGFLENIGYFYREDIPNSRMKILHSPEHTNKLFRSLFSIMKYYYKQSDNNFIEKKLIAYNFFKLKINKYIKDINKLTGEFSYIIDILNLYLKSPFFSQKQKYDLNFFKNKIENRRKKFKSFIIKN